MLLFYVLVLSRLKCFHFNRIYLLFAVVFSMIIPLVSVPNLWKNSQQPILENRISDVLGNNDVFPEKDNIQIQKIPIINDDLHPISSNKLPQIQTNSSHFPLNSFLWMAYFLISFLLLTRFVWGIFKLIELIRKNEKQKIEKYSFILLKKSDSPFTFLQYIFVNKKNFKEREISESVIIHEKQHANELHSIDLIFMNLVQIVAWFNPFLSFFQKYIRENHEYLADNAVLKQETDKNQYQQLILEMQLSNRKENFQLANNFNFLSIKKRFLMMNRNNKPRKNILLTLLSIPLILAGIWVFAQKKDKEDKTLTTLSTQAFKQSHNEIPTSNGGITQEQFDFYIAQMKKGNYKIFDSKNRNRDWFKDLQNSLYGDSLISLYKNMTWQQKSLTNTTMPYEVMDSLSDYDWHLYNQTVNKLLTIKQKKDRDSLPHRQFENKNENMRTYDQPICLDDKYVKKYGYLNVMLHYMSQ
ncbi:MAG: hypothetical protein DI598_19325, partial [Pseudopedobacter saltans]